MEKEIKYEVRPVDGKIVIKEEVRTGTLPAVKELKTLRINGNILAPVKYLEHMDAYKTQDPMPVVFDNVENHFIIDRSTTHALVDLNQKKIVFYVNKDKEYSEYYQAVIYGQLMQSGDLGRFNINEQDEMSPRKMADKLKRLKIFFQDKHQNHEIVNTLMNLVGKTTKDFSRAEDIRGNRQAMIDKKVNTNLPEAFNLCLPIFEGFPALTFQVEIGIDDRDGGLSVWLESAELYSLIIEGRDEIIHTEVEKLEKDGILVIIQNPG